MRFVAAIVAACVVAACSPSLLPEDRKPDPELDVVDACEAACTNLRSPRVGCPEGTGSIGGEPCGVVCVRASQLRPLPLACWASASSAVEARGCGSLRCIR